MEGSKLIVLHSYIVVLVVLSQSTFAVVGKKRFQSFNKLSPYASGNDVKIDFPYEKKRHLIAGQYTQPMFNRVPVSTDDDNAPAGAAIQPSGLTMLFSAKDDDSLLEDTSLSFDLNSGHSNLSLSTLGILAREFNMPHEWLAFGANDPLVTGQGELHSGSMGWKDKFHSVTRQRDSEMKLDPGIQSGSKNYQITNPYDSNRAVDNRATEQLLKQIDDSESLVPYDHLSAIRPNRGIILSEGHYSSKILDSLRSKSVQTNSQSVPKSSYLSEAARTFEENRTQHLIENWRGPAEVDRSAYNSLILDPLIKRLLASHSTSPVLVRNKRTPLSELLQEEIFTDTDSDIPEEMSDEPPSILEDEVLFSIPQLRSASDVIDTPAVPNTTTPSPLIVIPTAAPNKQTPVPTAVPTPQPWPITTPYPPTTTSYAVPTPLLNTTISSSAFASLGAMGGTGELSFDQLPTTFEVDTRSTLPVSCLGSRDTLIINRSVSCDERIKRQAPLSTDQMIELLQYHGIAENSPFTATSRQKASDTFRNLLPFGSPDKERVVHQRFTVHQLAMLLEKKYQEKQGAWHRDHISTDQDSLQTSAEADTTNRKVSKRKSRVSRRVNFDLLDDEFDVSRHLRETEEQYIPEEFLKRMEPARQLGHFTGMRKRSADTDIGYCQRLDEQNEAGYLNLCSACQKTTNLGEDTFPSYINEVVCNPSQTGGCIQFSGTVHGQCYQTSIHVQMLRRQSGTCMIISSQGHLMMTDAWELYSQEIRTGCQCMIDKRSPLIG